MSYLLSFTYPQDLLMVSIRSAKNDHFVIVSCRPPEEPKAGVNQVEVTGNVEIEGYESGFTLTWDRCYTVQQHVPSEWDTPRIELNSWDCAGARGLPWEVRSKAADMVHYLADYLFGQYIDPDMQHRK